MNLALTTTLLLSPASTSAQGSAASSEPPTEADQAVVAESDDSLASIALPDEAGETTEVEPSISLRRNNGGRGSQLSADWLDHLYSGGLRSSR